MLKPNMEVPRCPKISLKYHIFGVFTLPLLYKTFNNFFVTKPAFLKQSVEGTLDIWSQNAQVDFKLNTVWRHLPRKINPF